MNKIKLISLLAAAAVMTGSVAMAETYSATGNGYHGEMTVNVTIEDGKITDVELGDNHETNVVIDRAFPVIRERILEANTADVDSVTAATFSSYAIKTAVADAMQQAGLEAPKVAMQNAEKTATERAAESCDIVIVGGGPAGLAAAVSAKQTNADKNVILVEKLDILSGNGKFDMNFFDMINTEAQKAAGNDEWVGEAGLAKFLEEKSSNGESAERIQVWANEEYNLDAWLRAMGVELNYNYGGTNHMAEDNQYSGEVIQAGLEKAAAELGVDVRTGTKGVDLVMEDGACKGVIVTNNAGETYTINAASTIITTGGFCSNKELLAEYAGLRGLQHLQPDGHDRRLREDLRAERLQDGEHGQDELLLQHHCAVSRSDRRRGHEPAGQQRGHAPAEQVRHGSRHDDQGAAERRGLLHHRQDRL